MSATSDSVDRTVLEKASDGLGITKAAAHLGVTAPTIRKWIKDGKLPATKFGPEGSEIVRIDPADLDKLRRQA